MYNEHLVAMHMQVCNVLLSGVQLILSTTGVLY